MKVQHLCFQSPKKQEAWTNKKAAAKPETQKQESEPSATDQSEPWNSDKQVEPTPREDRITRDYAQEFPSVEVESRKVVRREGGTKGKDGLRKSIEQVKLTEEEVSLYLDIFRESSIKDFSRF